MKVGKTLNFVRPKSDIVPMGLISVDLNLDPVAHWAKIRSISDFSSVKEMGHLIYIILRIDFGDLLVGM